MSELIKRNDAVEAIEFEKVYMTAYRSNNGDYVNEGNLFTQYNKGLDDAIKAINNLPSAEPEHKWIPVTEALPEEDIDVLLLMAEGEMAVGQRRGMNFWDGYRRRGNIIAWMPLPEPAIIGGVK